MHSAYFSTEHVNYETHLVTFFVAQICIEHHLAHFILQIASLKYANSSIEKGD